MAGTIDQLNFEVIVSDKEFDAQIKDIEKKARAFNASLSDILNIRKVSTQMSQKDVENARRLGQAKVDEIRAQEKINREKIKTEGLQKKINAQIERATKGYQGQSRILQELKGYALGYLSIHGATQLLSSLVRVTGEFELQKTTLAAMLGDLNQAENVITRIQGLAVESPFQFKELTTYAKQLSAFSVPAQELYDTTKMLADISAGLGVGMDRIVLAYGQVRSAAFLRGQEVRQFTEAGIPILDELAKQFSELEGRAVSAGEVFDKISARLVPFEMVAKVFQDMTSEGGKFYNMQEIQAETLRGKISNLKDAYDVMLNTIGQGQSENLKGAVDWARRLMTNYEDTGRTLIELIATYGIYRTTLALTTSHITTLSRLHAVLRGQMAKLTKALSSNPYVALAAGVTAVIGVMYKLGKEMKSQSAIAETLNKSQEEWAENVNKNVIALDALYAKINLAKEGSKEYNTAIGTLQRTYAPYIEQLKAEGVEVENLATLYDKLVKKVRESAQIRFVESARQDLDQTYAQELSDIINGTGSSAAYNLKRAMEALDLNEAEGTILRMFLSGNATWDEITERYGELAEKVNDAYISLGAGSSGPMKAKDYLDILKNSITSLTNQYTTAIAVVDEFAIKVKETGSGERLVDGWRKIVQDTLTGMDLNKDSSFGLWADEFTQSTTYVEDMIKRYKELKDQIALVSPFDEEQTRNLERNQKAIEAVAKALGLDIVALTSTKTKGSTGKSEEEKRLENLIGILKQLKEQYEELKALGVSDSAITALFKGSYPGLLASEGADFFSSLDFSARLKQAISDLSALNPLAAKSMLTDEEGGGIEEYIDNLKEAEKAVSKYYETIRKWLAEDYNLEGDGITFDISKIASDLNEKYKEIDLRANRVRETLSSIDLSSQSSIEAVKNTFEKEFGEGSWDAFYAEYILKGEEAIAALAAKQKEYEKKQAQERVNNLVGGYVKDATSNLSLSDWGDKSIMQVSRIKKAFNEISSAEITLPDSLKDDIEAAGLNIDEFTKKVKESFGAISQEIDDEMLKKIVSLGKLIGEQVLQISSSLRELGEVSGNEGLTQVSIAISEIGESFGAIMEGFQSGGVIGGIVAGVASLATKIIDAVIAQEKLARAIEETATQQKILNSEYAIMEGVDGIFGTNSFEKFLNAYEEATAAYEKVREDLAEQERNIWGGTDNNSGDWGKIGGLGGGAALGAIIGSIFPGIGTAIGAGIGALVGMIVGSVTDAALEADDYLTSLQEMADSINAPLINEETGAFNLETLKSIKETYKDLSAEDKAWIDGLIANVEVYENALAAMAEYTKSVFGSVADEVADAFINSFKEAGTAALDYADIMDGVASQIAKDIIKATLLQEVFDEELSKNAAKELASGNTAGAMALVEQALESAKDLSPYIQSFLESMEPYFQMGEEDASNLGEGIKGITEDTANLLASYLNAIRADVSYARSIWERMDSSTQQIATILAGFNAPNLMEYQAQIAANTYNTAMYTQAIMEDLQSVLTSEGGYSAIRTYS